MAIAPRTTVQGAPRTPLPYSLWSVVDSREPGQARWELGVQFDALPCDTARGIAIDCPPGDLDLDPAACSIGNAEPFMVYGYSIGTPVGLDRSQQARDHLEARGIARAERAFQTGDLGNTPYLNDSPDVLAGGSPVSIQQGVGLLEAYIASHYGSVGVIHMDRNAALQALADGELTTSGSRLTTKLGTPVAAGAGYDGATGPMAASDGTSWIYGTPAVFGLRSDPSLAGEAPFDTGTNDQISVAQQAYLFGYDPCGVAAVLVTAQSGGGGEVGPAGKSAYEIAVDNGFEGTEEQWLESLVGPPGTDGTDGTDGQDGTNATVTVGTTSTLAAGSEATVTNSGTSTDAVLDFGIPEGEQGVRGTDGTDGSDGADGVVQTVAAGTGIAVDSTDPANPIVSTTA